LTTYTREISTDEIGGIQERTQNQVDRIEHRAAFP